MARKFGGRPTERTPEPGKRTHLSLAVPLKLKRELERAAKTRGWSISNEAAHRLESSFERQGFLPDVLRLAYPDTRMPGFADMLIGAHEAGILSLPPDRIDALVTAVRAQIEGELIAAKERTKR